MRLEGERVFLRPLEADDAPELLALLQANRDFIGRREAIWSDEFLTVDAQRARLEAMAELRERDSAVFFGIFDGGTGVLAGYIGVFGIIRGSFQEARVGYAVGEAWNGRGFASEALRLAVAYGFGGLGLHRFETGAQPDNAASCRVLEKAGFRREGTSVRWVHVQGEWVDAVRFALTAEEWDPQRAAPRP